MIGPPPVAAYENTPFGDMRHAIAANAFPKPGDPVKTVQAMIDSVDRPATRRLPLGSDTYTLIRSAYVERLAALDAHKDIALSTDTTPLNP